VSDSLIVVSWNVHVGGGDIPALVADLRSGALTGTPVLGGFVILLQETHRAGVEALRRLPGQDAQTLHYDPPDGTRLDVVEVAERLGLDLAYAPAEPNGSVAPDGPLEDRGVAILSDLPLSGARVIELPNERQRRVALIGTVRGVRCDGSAWNLRVATAHLENRAPWRRFLDSFGAVRSRQARTLLRQLGDDPVVLGADLNNWGPDFLEPALDMVRRRFPDSPEADGPTYSVAGVSRRLDHLFFRLPAGTTAEVRVASDRYGSDHAPVLGVVELGRPESLPAR
jgi:endonuclease/exonuclease/phosphatase family metal-dependent hydrolase